MYKEYVCFHITLSIHLTLSSPHVHKLILYVFLHCCPANFFSTICKIDSQWEFAVWLRELKQGLCINLEGWDREEDEREVQEGGDICIPMADSCRCLTGNNKIL